MTGERRDEGSILVKLMLAGVIFGVIRLVAIPAFVSLTSSARVASAESNLSTAVTDQGVFYAAYDEYGTPATTPPVASVDAGLKWRICSLDSCIRRLASDAVYVEPISADDGTAAVIRGAGGANDAEFWVYQDISDGRLEYLVNRARTPPAIRDFSAQSWAKASEQ